MNIIPPKSIAVLPFVNMSASQDNEYFSDGITEEIINALAKINGLKVTSRTSSFHFKGKNISMSEIGLQLGVSTLLEGSIRLAGNIMRITAQLIDASNDFHFWSETWDRKLENVFEVQDEISLIIADKLREHFGHLEIDDHLVHQSSNNVEAYQLFLKGRQLFNKWNPEQVKDSMAFYKQAIALDPNHAEAMAGLADAYSFLATTGAIPFDEGWSKSETLTNKALEIDHNLSLAHYQLANLAFFTKSDYAEAFNRVNTALEINPNHIESLQFKAFLHIIAAKKNEAKKLISIAISTDPLSQETQFYQAYIEYMTENYAEALQILNSCLAINPNNIPAHTVKALALVKLQRFEDAITYFDFIPNKALVENEKIGIKAIAYALLKDQAKSVEAKQELEHVAKTPNGFAADSYRFLLAGATEQNNEAFNWIEKALKSNTPLALLRYCDPMVNPIKSDSRYEEYYNKLYPNVVTPTKSNSEIKKALLNEQDTKDYKIKLLDLINTQKIHLNPHLSLRLLAKKLGIHPNQLSWLLNTGFEKNFNEFINHYRIEAFKEQARLPQNAHLTLLAIAYDCGFNSKTVFNTYFKKETGKTPKQFLNS